MADKYYRSAYINVDLNAVSANFNTISTLHHNKTVIAVIKANAYGLGSVKVAQHLMQHGASFFAVATLDEAIELRMHGITAKILVLGVIPPADVNKAIQHRIALTAPSKQWLKEMIKNISAEQTKKIWIHVKLDTGMGRLGIKDINEYQEVIDIITQQEQLVFEGVYTHFACADEPGEYTSEQYQLFKDMVNQFDKPQYVHCQNSAATLLMDGQFCNAVRPGIALYGYYPSEYVKEHVKVHLKPSIQLVTNVVQAKSIQPGESVSYGATYTATEPTKIAVLPVGYADGYLRIMQGSYVNVNGHQCEIIGRVCMDQMIVKVPENIKAGDSVILIDNHRESEQSAEQVADKQQTIVYEVLCNLSRRLPRVYHDGDDIDVTNELLK